MLPVQRSRDLGAVSKSILATNTENNNFKTIISLAENMGKN